MLRFFFPLLFGTLFQQLYNTVDAVIVGRFVGKIALSAVGGTSAMLINLLVGFFLGLSSGASVIVAQFYGAKRDKEVSLSVHTAVAMALFGGVLIMIIGEIATPAYTRLLRTPEAVVGGTILYLRIFFLGMVPNLFYNVGAAILRAVGDSKRPLYYLIASCIANIFLDLFFVVMLDMGVAGVAVATILSQLLSALLVLVTLVRTDENYRLTIRQIRFDLPILKRMMHIGIPGGIQSSVYMISNTIIQAFVNGFGTDIMAAWTACGKADVVVWLVFGAFAVTVTTFVGQNHGAGKPDRVRQSVRTAFIMTMGAVLLLGVLIYSFGHYLMYLFTTDAAVVESGAYMLRFFSVFYWTYVCVEIFSGALRGMGEALIPTVIDLFGVCVLRLLWVFLYVPRHYTIDSVMYSYPLSWIVTSVFFVIYFIYYMKARFPRTYRSASS